MGSVEANDVEGKSAVNSNTFCASRDLGTPLHQAYEVEDYFPSADHGSILITSPLAWLTRLSGGSQKLAKVTDEQAIAMLENTAGKSIGKSGHQAIL